MKPSLLIIGLGNPGKQYDRTRHNAGFEALDELFAAYGEGEWKPMPKFDADISEGRIGVMPIFLVKPQTYMNLSGDSIRKLVDFYKLDPSTQVLVLCDDIDLPLGELRFRRNGGPGTHNGLKSIVSIFGEEFMRLRIGIGSQPRGYDLSSWVLSRFTDEEGKVLSEAYKSIPDVIGDALAIGS